MIAKQISCVLLVRVAVQGLGADVGRVVDARDVGDGDVTRRHLLLDRVVGDDEMLGASRRVAALEHLDDDVSVGDGNADTRSVTGKEWRVR